MIRLMSLRLPGAASLKLALGFCLLLATSPAAAQMPEPDYLLYGGAHHTVFLGCLNCSRFDSVSVWNQLGPHGSQYDGETIWNKLSAYGSPHNPLSPWHPHSFDAPLVKDREGNSYGTFTRNVHDSERTKVPSLLWILENYDSVIANLNAVRERY